MTPQILFLGSLRNPLGQGWAESLAIAGNDVLFRTAEGDVARWLSDGHRVAAAGQNRSKARAGASTPEEPLARAAASAGEGEPDLVFAWWGTEALRALVEAGEAHPSARRVLCVDTFPNASMWVTEVRERQRLRSFARDIDGLVYPSPEMRATHVGAVPWLESIPWVALPQPLPARAHARHREFLPDELTLPPTDGPRLVLTGRADLLWTRDPRMRKDALGDALIGLEGAGFEVWTSGHFAAEKQSRFRTYPTFSTEEMLDGTFATYIAQFDGQLALYNVANGTLRRRVSAGLSTRFAFGLASPSPLIVPPESRFAAKFLREHPIGIVLDDPQRLRADVERRQSDIRAAWTASHHSWTAEGQSDLVQRFLLGLRRRS